MGLNFMTFAVDREEQHWRARMPTEEFRGNISGKQLIISEVKKSRQEEMQEVYKHQVYVKVPISECRQTTGREPIGTRWVDVNKEDNKNREYRSRLVAQELKCHSTTEENMFAATPPWEAKKVLFSLAVT